ncbi:hypothetical protein CA13_22560 [Planctomycetes bacterium CA13]|uniref:Response regulatory domain-containing protein n=1 Tax=Novipirellula herctigrandis TaxID=2527986 RepID=A0A5C5Z0W7_9BACT|nr:hypothetical protein CA13_22560 [Planctomycetes bacterium CA13]
MVKPSIVIAEDDPAFRNVLHFLMTRMGFAVESFSDGQLAYERLKSYAADLLITDQQMPHCSGIDLLQKIANDEAIADIPAVLCTAKGLELDTQSLVERFSIVAIMHKPFSPRKLGQFVREFLVARQAA